MHYVFSTTSILVTDMQLTNQIPEHFTALKPQGLATFEFHSQKAFSHMTRFEKQKAVEEREEAER